MKEWIVLHELQASDIWEKKPHQELETKDRVTFLIYILLERLDASDAYTARRHS